MDQAKQNMEQDKYDLQNFSRELNDVNMACNLNINKWNEKRMFVDNLFHPVDTHHFYSFGTFLFSAFCTGYIMRGVSFSSEIGWRATISSPCISIRYWSSVIAIASSAERGHRNAPLSSLLYIRRKPSPSQSSALIRSHLLPQKRNSVFLS